MIVGAGVAGLSAAVRLAEAGLEDVTVLEAGQRVGGRVCSQAIRQVQGAARVELGAQWIHGEKDNVVFDIAKKFDFLPAVSASVEESEAIFIDNEGKLQEDDEQLGNMMKIISSVEEDMKKMTITHLKEFRNLQEYYEARVNQEMKERGLTADSDFASLSSSYLHWYGQLQGSINGWAWTETASYQNLVYRECEGDETTTLKTELSYQELVEKYADSVLDKVKFDRMVEKVEYSEDNVKITTSSGDQFLADYAVITLPLGVLKADQAKLFSPALPGWKQLAIQQMGFGANAKVFLIFATKISEMVPDLRPAGFNFLRTEGSRTESSWTDSVFGLYPDQADPFTLVAWLSGTAARQVEELPEAELLQGMSWLVSVFLVPAFPHFSLPVTCRVTPWCSSHLSRGSYSFLGPASPASSPEVLARPVGRLLWAGEASHQHYFSTVHGAMETGWREADRILGLSSG